MRWADLLGVFLDVDLRQPTMSSELGTPTPAYEMVGIEPRNHLDRTIKRLDEL